MRARWKPVVLMGAWLLAASSFAHEDTPLRRRDDGTLEGLPVAYAPAAVHVRYAEDAGASKVVALALVLRDKRIALPPCLLRTITARRKPHLQVHASWYHDLTRFPPAITIELMEMPRPDAREWERESFTFDLRTGALLLSRRVRKHWLFDSWRTEPIQVRALCSKLETKGLLDARYPML